MYDVVYFSIALINSLSKKHLIGNNQNLTNFGNVFFAKFTYVQMFDYYDYSTNPRKLFSTVFLGTIIE